MKMTRIPQKVRRCCFVNRERRRVKNSGNKFVLEKFRKLFSKHILTVFLKELAESKAREGGESLCGWS
jgi:hypothetical protein